MSAGQEGDSSRTSRYRKRPLLRGFSFHVKKQAAAASVEKPRGKNTANVKGEEPPQGCLHPTREHDRRAVAFGNEERTVSRNGGSETDDCSGFHLHLLVALLQGHFRLELRHFLSHDCGNHLEGRCVAHAAREEQQEEARKEPPEGIGLILHAEEIKNAENAERHCDEYPERHAPTAILVRDPAGGGTRDGAHQRPEEGKLQRIDARKLRFGEQRKSRRIADEGAERPGIKPAHDPVVLALENY